MHECRGAWWFRGRCTMSRETAETDRSIVTRRRALAGVGALAVGGTTLSLASAPVGASVQIDAFDVADATFEAEQVDPRADATVAYEYDVGDDAVDHLAFRLLVGDDQVASDELSTSRALFEGTHSLVGRVVDAAAFSTADFEVAPGEQVTHEISVGVEFGVRDYDERVLASATASDTATVVVAHPDEDGVYASLGGAVEIVDGE